MYNSPSSVSCNSFNGFTESSKTNRDQIELNCSVSRSKPFYHCKAPPPAKSTWKLEEHEDLRPIFHNMHINHRTDVRGSFIGIFCDPPPTFTALLGDFAKPKKKKGIKIFLALCLNELVMPFNYWL